MMRYIRIALIRVGCNSEPDIKTVLEENKKLQKEVYSLKIELNTCDMMLKAYQGIPLGI